MLWWEILILVIVVGIAAPFITIAWISMINNVIDTVRRRRMNRNLQNALEKLSKQIDDSVGELSKSNDEAIRQEYLKEIEEIEKEFKEKDKK